MHLRIARGHQQARFSCKPEGRKPMRKAPAFALAFLCSAWMCAQTGGNDTRTTITGCLNRSSDHYTLTDKSGTTYEMAGDTAKLDEHVGNTIAVTGVRNSPAPDARANPGTTANPGNPGSINTFDVSSVKHLANGCGSSR